jgi:signal transduction histidine kinase
LNRECFIAVTDRLGEPVFLLDLTFRVVAANRAAHRVVEVRDGDRLLEHVTEPEAVAGYLRLASRSGAPTPGNMTLLTDREQPWRCEASRLGPAEEGGDHLFLRLRGIAAARSRFIALNDQIAMLHAEIRRRTALEEERERLLQGEREARQEAEQANRLKDEFLAAVSHELRTPLHAVTGWLSLLRSNPQPDIYERALEVIERNVAAQSKLTEDLVDVSRVISGRMRLSLQPVDLSEIVRQAVDSVRPAAEARQQRIEMIANAGDCLVHADPERMLQVVWNLLSNATKFTPKRGRIQVVVRRVNSHCEILVSDTGEGISREMLPYVFDRFRQGDATTTRRHGGLGLGLAIVRHLVELHGGMVMAHSEGEGEGTTITVNLPLPMFERQQAVERTPDGETAPPGPPAPLAGFSALLVEDHADSRDLLEQILTRSGATVVAVPDAESALARFVEQRPDVVVSDIELPGEDGFTLMRKLRDHERIHGLPQVPAVAVTAHTIGDARVHALRSGYQSFLTKPIHPGELVAMIQSLCGLV